MRRRIVLALILATSLVGPAAAQNDRGGVHTETQARLAGGGDPNLIWNILGLFGLIGLLGLRQEHPDDGYHPSSVE
jgi:UPF0716 family protein affecting phage T7 exclusion